MPCEAHNPMKCFDSEAHNYYSATLAFPLGIKRVDFPKRVT